jgi:hypothetical protein
MMMRMGNGRWGLGFLVVWLLLCSTGSGCGSSSKAMDAAPAADAPEHTDAPVDRTTGADARTDAVVPACLLADGGVGSEPCPLVTDASTSTCTEQGRVCHYQSCGAYVAARCAATADGGPLGWILTILIR